MQLEFVRCKLVKDKTIRYKCSTPRDVTELAVEIAKRLIGDADREYCLVLSLGTDNTVLNASIVSIGSVSQAIVNPREVFKTAILSNASKIIFVHNHPSGDPTPSGIDYDTVDRLKKAGEILGIQLVDAVIIGDGYYSFLAHNEL